jgi:hypothetical protein
MKKFINTDNPDATMPQAKIGNTNFLESRSRRRALTVNKKTKYREPTIPSSTISSKKVE